MDYVDFCFLPNNATMSYLVLVANYTCINHVNTHYTSSILTEALFATK